MRTRDVPRPHLLVVVSALGLVFSSGCFNNGKKNASAPEAAETVLANAVQKVGEEMRPIRGEQRLLIFAIDGLGRNEMAQILASNKLAPMTRALVGDEAAQGDVLYEHGYLTPDTLSVLPSATIAGWSTIFTGANPAHSGVPGNEFFVRETSAFYAIAPTGVSGREHALKAVNDGLLNDLLEAPTLYEQVDLSAHVSLSQVHGGADLITTPENALAKFVTNTTVSPVSDEEVKRAPYAAIDEESFDSMKAGWEQYGLPDIQVAYLPGLDLYSHSTENAPAEQPSYYNDVIDPFVQQVLEGYRARKVLEKTWIVFVSDHGHTPVMADSDHALEAEDFAEKFEEVGFTLRPPVLAAEPKNFDAVLASQGGLANVYLARRDRCQVGKHCTWSATPRWEEDVMPVAKMLDAYNDDPKGLGGKNAAVLTRDPSDPGAPFGVWDDGKLHPLAEWLHEHDLSHQMDLERRLQGLTVGPFGRRAGEIILLARYGMRYPKEERYYFAKPMYSEHGSGTVEDSRFTLLVAHPKKSGAETAEIVESVTRGAPRQEHFVPLVKKLLKTP